MAKSVRSESTAGEEPVRSPGEVPAIFKQAADAWGYDPEMWQIWLRDAYRQWQLTGEFPSGNLDEVLGKKPGDQF